VTRTSLRDYDHAHHIGLRRAISSIAEVVVAGLRRCDSHSSPAALKIICERLRTDVAKHSTVIDCYGDVIGAMPSGQERDDFAALRDRHIAALIQTRAALRATEARLARAREAGQQQNSSAAYAILSDWLEADANTHATVIDCYGEMIAGMSPGPRRDDVVERREQHVTARAHTLEARGAVEAEGARLRCAVRFVRLPVRRCRSRTSRRASHAARTTARATADPDGDGDGGPSRRRTLPTIRGAL
jgi:hypothetical protein